MIYLSAILALVGYCTGYSLGPPLSACGNMMPAHDHAPQTIASPFTFTLNTTTYMPGDVVEVFLNSSGEWFLEGALIQVRREDCDNALSAQAQTVGTFIPEESDVFLQAFNCFGRTASAIRHYSHLHIYNRTFYWRAPSEPMGHVRLRATIARNKETFWVNVMSDYIWDASDSDHQTCGAIGPVLTIAFMILSLLFTYVLS